MNRRRHSTDSSLELLLDTICNTFGGILFLALLLVVLLQATSATSSARSQPAQDRQASSKQRMRLEELEAEVSTLRREALRTSATLSQVSTPSTVELVSDLTEQLKLRDDLHAKLRETRQANSQRQSALENASIGIQDVDRQLAIAERSVKEARSKITAAADERRQQIVFSQVHESAKTQFVWLVRYGKLYVVRHPSGEINSNDVEVGLFPKIVTPKPTAGFAIRTDQSTLDRIKATIAHLSPQRDAVAMFIWSDSFGQFEVLRDTLLELDLDYRLVPLTPDGAVVIGVSSEDSNLVQ